MDDELLRRTNQEINQEFMPPHKPQKKTKSRAIVLCIIALVLVTAVGFFMFRDSSSQSTTNEATGQSAQAQQKKKRVRLIATGDMIPHDAINKAAQQADESYEYSPMFGDMKRLFDASDVRFCNQAVLAGGREFGVSGYPKFNSPIEFTRDMAELGCNVINTGSNHTNDFNQDVISASVQAWGGQPGVLAVAGANAVAADKQKVHYFEKNGITFAFVSYTTYTNEPSPNGYSVTMYDDALAQTQLAEARNKADIVIASLRWGTEYSPDINSQQKIIGQKIANYGADIIVGHGPHVLQPFEILTLDDGRKAYIWYSLGNFLNAQLELETLFNVIAVMDINPDTKKIDSVGYVPIYMHYEWSAADKAAGRLLERKNFSMFTFEDGQDALDRSQNDTTFDAQKHRISETLSKFTQLKLLTKDDYLGS